MTTLTEKTKETAVKLCLSLLFVLGSLSLCQAQGVLGDGHIPGLDVPGPVPVQSSAPTLNGWESSDGADMVEMANGASFEMVVSFVPSIIPLGTPVSIVRSAPSIVPEPSTIGLLLAGSAALVRFGWRKRCN
jgi:hypothetical protein